LRDHLRCPPKMFASAVGTFRTWGHVGLESVIGTKADVRRPLRVYEFTP
jgi:hypothetical protein